PARVDPGAGDRVAVERAPVIGGRALLSAPDGERVAVDLVHVVEGLALAAVVAGRDVLARPGAEGPLPADHLHALDRPAVLDQVDLLDEEEAAVEPAVGDGALGAAGHPPGAGQAVQGAELLVVGVHVAVLRRRRCPYDGGGGRKESVDLRISPAARTRPAPPGRTAGRGRRWWRSG